MARRTWRARSRPCASSARRGSRSTPGWSSSSETALPRGTGVGVFVAGGYAYVTALGAGLFVYDVSQPATPVKVAELTPNSDVWYRAWVKDQTLYVSSNREGLLLFNVTDPKAPVRIGALPVPAVQAWGLVGERNGST